ncbi:hypothetical protein BT93_H1556 [Corymbia citriodora subsp. variegata]|nr:hypothetical protein BT93_H1556 [Corymbia citriodora subsp. variegata]
MLIPTVSDADFFISKQTRRTALSCRHLFTFLNRSIILLFPAISRRVEPHSSFDRSATLAPFMASSYGGPYDRPPPQPYAPSATALTDAYGYGQQQLQQYPPQPPYGSSALSLFGSGYHASFPPGTDPEAIRSFEMADSDWSGYIEEKELQQALGSGSYQGFSIRTVRLLMFLFKNPIDPLRLGPKEFAALWSCLGQWRAIFERFDRDRSGKIDSTELRDALYSLGYVIPPSVLQVLMSKYDGSSSRTCELNFGAFVECGMILKVPYQVNYMNCH